MSINPKTLFSAVLSRAVPEEKVSSRESTMLLTNRACFYKVAFKDISFATVSFAEAEEAFETILAYIPDEWGTDEEYCEWDTDVLEVNRKARLIQVVHELQSVKKRRAFF
ncbi:hypothetical protein P9597_10620 [Aneurinibacillus migulanus]|uniref:hypothetical protein n=1 Tax=Aneurinibacillus migulanus TaxID=47500 RepID=UPI002E1CF4E8|nr:hypothetical protein [Aneurinibacillus migulanus]